MYVHLNCLDYDALMEEIVEYYQLKDTIITNDMISKIFKDIAAKVNPKDRESLTEEEISLVEALMKMGLSYRDYDGNDNHDFDDDVTSHTTHLLLSLEEALENPSEVENPVMAEFIDKFLSVFNENDPDEASYFQDAIARLGIMVTMYHRPDTEYYTDGELAILKYIECNLMNEENLGSLTVLDIPGKTIKHGDTLITFPTILIKAY